MKVLVLAEKPSVGKEIARVLNCNIKNKGYFEGSGYVVTWALGHLVTLAEPEDYEDKYKQWRLEDLPMIPGNMKLKVIRETSHQFGVVINLMKRGDMQEMVIATDAGREGELVARWIMVLAGWKKPFKRLWISSQTDNAIKEGFANLKPGMAYNNLYDAAVCRTEADWLIGLNVTRALTCKFNAQLSAGRVQTPTLAMIVNRESEIKQFVPVDFWTIRADFGEYFGDWREVSGNSRIFDYAKAEQIADKVKGHPGVIKDLRTESKSEPPPLAYDLTELQRDANKRYGFSAQKTLSVLQDLYERHKIVTYPRTDSRYITTDMVPTLSGRLKAMAAGPYVALVKPLLQKPLAVTKRLVDNTKVSDHHAIIPTEQPLQLTALTADEKNLYDLIAKRFIATLYPPFRYDQITLITVVNGESFYSGGKVEKDPGWRVVTTKQTEKEDRDEDLPEQTLTVQQKGAQKQMKSCKVSKSKTKPPARYTEATLLTAMESPGKFIEDEELRESIKQAGLGTPATRADIIEKLLYTSYIERQGKELVPTSKGIQLVKLVNPALKSPELTAQWEQRLANISKGKDRRADFMASIRENTNDLVKSIISDSSTVYKADNITRTKCPLCSKYMLLVNGKRGKMLACPDRECGHRQPEKEETFGNMRSSKSAERINQRLISQYSDRDPIGNSLGDKLKMALTEKKDGGEK
jgi:DNA topoisomerase III